MKRTILIITLLLAVFTSACVKENPVVCTMDAKECPDGTFVGRIPPDCEFEKCPDTSDIIAPPEDKKPAIICTEEQKAAKICTMEFMPVCGSDGVTYGNKCGACAAGIDSYTEGECYSEDEIK